MRITAIFAKTPHYFWIACSVSLTVVAASLIYGLNYAPSTPPELTDSAPASGVSTAAPELAALPDVEPLPDASSAPVKQQHQDYWSSIVTEGPHAGLTRAEAQRRINSELKEWKAELEQMLEWYQEMGDEIKRDNVRIEAVLARSKAENDAVLADLPATPLALRLIEEGYTDEEIARHPEFIRLMTEYLGIDYLSTDE